VQIFAGHCSEADVAAIRSVLQARDFGYQASIVRNPDQYRQYRTATLDNPDGTVPPTPSAPQSGQRKQRTVEIEPDDSASLIRFDGDIRGQGQFYSDGREILFIAIDKAAAAGFPYREGERVPVELELGGQVFTAGTRTTPPQTIVYIPSDLQAADGKKVSLASVLESAGMRKGQWVTIEAKGSRLRVLPRA
jgi:hypothetical protein